VEAPCQWLVSGSEGLRVQDGPDFPRQRVQRKRLGEECEVGSVQVSVDECIRRVAGNEENFNIRAADGQPVGQLGSAGPWQYYVKGGMT